MQLPPLTADTASQFRTQSRPLNLRPSTPTMDNNTKRAALSNADMNRMSMFKLNGNSWATKTQPEKVASAQADADVAKQAADVANNPATIAKETVSGTAKSLAGGAVKFLRSAAMTIPDTFNALMGKAPVDTSKLGGTYQEDAAGTTGKVFEGQESPLAGAVSTVGGVVGGAADVLGGAEGIGAAAKFGEKTVGNLIANQTEKSVAKDALDVVTPKLTKSETESALASGRGQGGGLLSKTKITPDSRLLEVADATKGIVMKGATGAENINNVRSALSSEADNLISKVAKNDHSYSFKELNSKMSSVEKPISIKSDSTLSRQFDLTRKAALDIAKKNGGNISGLLKSRKEFDALVEKEFPNLYDRENAPMRNAVTSIRNSMNDFIDKNLPEGSGFKDSLKKQSLFYDAIDNIAGKSAEETRSTGLERIGSAVKKHPVGALLTGGAAAEGVRKITTGSF